MRSIDCEIIEADDFEAMRQTYKRNQHGRHNPIRLGQMFRHMMHERSISGRQLAKEIGVSEGSIRNAVNYARAASVRSGYAFEALSQDQIRHYLRLPKPINDLWLDAGARPNFIKQALAVTLGKEGRKRGWKLTSSNDDGMEFFEFIAGSDLWKTIEAKDFVATTQRAFRLMEWQFRYRIENLEKYVSVIAQLKLPVEVLFEIPIADSPNADNKYSVLISPEKWREMLSTCLRSDDNEEQIAIARAARRVLLKELGVSTSDTTDPRNIELENIVNDAPDFIRDSDLDLNEKALLADAHSDEIPEEILLEAKRLATKRLTDRKRILENGNREQLRQFHPILTLSVKRILEQALQETASDHERREQDEKKRQQQHDAEQLLSNPQELATAIADALAPTSLKKFLINKRPAIDVLVTRLCSLPEPELKLIAAHLIGHKELSLRVWFQSVKRECQVDQLE